MQTSFPTTTYITTSLLANSVRFLLLITLLSTASLSQDRSGPRLFDEFSKISCEEMMARTDGLFSEVISRPGSRAVVVIFGSVLNLREHINHEARIQTWAKFRNFPGERVTVIRRFADVPKVQFWVVPDSSKFEVPGEPWSLAVPKTTKPFVVWASDESGCGGEPGRSFAELLGANPAARGNIVLRGNDTEIRDARIELTKQFVGSFGIRRNRLRFFKADSATGFSAYEFWLVP